MFAIASCQGIVPMSPGKTLLSCDALADAENPENDADNEATPPRFLGPAITKAEKLAKVALTEDEESGALNDAATDAVKLPNVTLTDAVESPLGAGSIYDAATDAEKFAKVVETDALAENPIINVTV